MATDLEIDQRECKMPGCPFNTVMHLYLLTSASGDWKHVDWYDTSQGFVVRAADELSARKIASEQCGCEGEEVWLDASQTVCEPITHDGEPGMILRDFAAA